MENYFTKEAVQEEMGKQMRALQPFERLKDLSNCWSKSSNWRIARRMTFADIKHTDLGAFLEAL